MICKKCGKDTAEIDYSIVLTTYPSQYGIHCKNCGNVDYIFCKDAPPQYEYKVTRNCIVCKYPTMDAREHICPSCKEAIGFIKANKPILEEIINNVINGNQKGENK